MQRNSTVKYEGYPSGSMVDFACDAYGSPILAISSLAVHTKVSENDREAISTAYLARHPMHSGDSTVLAYVLSELNHRHNYGVNLFLLSVDEGIAGYMDDSLETVKRNEVQLWTTTKSGVLQGTARMDNGRNSEDYWIKEQLHILWCFPSPGRAVMHFQIDELNADDIAETVLLNILRGDIASGA
ncbi:unnamed protein product [Camellia sinensis]